MNKYLSNIRKAIILLFVMMFCMNISVYAQENEDDLNQEQVSFTECDGFAEQPEEFEQCVNGLYDVHENARASMLGVIRLYQSDGELTAVYSTSYSTNVNKIGVKNIALQYKGSLGLWHNIITLDNRYRTNAAAYQGSFSCNGVVGRVYRVKGTHYIIDDTYSESRDNVTGELTFR